MADFLVWCVWFAAGFACVASAIGVISFRNPFFSALALIGNLSALAVLYLLLGGEFVAAAQVLVYGGAVMVMFLFVIAYLGDQTERTSWAGEPTVTVLVAAAILLEVIFAISNKAGSALSHPATITRAFGSPAAIGRLFLTDHLLAFEVTSIVLLIAAVGGVVLGSHAHLAAEQADAEQGHGASM